MRYVNFRDGLTGELREMCTEAGRVLTYGPPPHSPSDDRDPLAFDLGGRYVLPAFVESHCHVLPTGLDLLKLHLGAAQSHADVLDLVRARHAEQPDGWLHAVHYDQNRYGSHLHREQLDAISPSRPILLRHVNGHASVANTAALKAAGVHENTPDPTGGVFVRDAAGRLTGVLLEAAHEHVNASSPAPSFDEMVAAILRAGNSMRDMGIVCATDMMTGFVDFETEFAAYRRAIELGCPVAIRLYVQWKSILSRRGVGLDRYRALEQDDRLRIAGVKIFADGAIGSATAAIYGSYAPESEAGKGLSARGQSLGGDGQPDVSGQLIYRPDRLLDMVRTADDAGFPIAIHAIGDYAVDLVMAAYAETSSPRRHRIEHAMLLSDAQIERLARLNCRVTFQPEFLHHFGRTYIRQLGAERAAHLKRARSVLDAGIHLSFSSDRPIVAGNPWTGILAASHRPEGFDPAENVSLAEAVHLYTQAAAEANDDADMGKLSPGSRAAFQVYETPPLDGDSRLPSAVFEFC